MRFGDPKRFPAPDPQAILTQCRHLRGNRAFKVSKRLRHLLQHLVERTLEHQEHSLGQRQLAVEVFGRNEGFDPERDAIVRIEMGKLRQALENYYVEAGQQDPVRIIIPRGSYVPEFRTGVATKPAAAPSTEAAPETRRTGIAVLPFRTVGGERDTNWLAEGLREELSLILTNIPELAVASHHALEPYLNPSVNLDAIRSELGVRFFLEGMVQHTGNRTGDAGVAIIVAPVIHTTNNGAIHITTCRHEHPQRHSQRLYRLRTQ